MYSSGFKPSVLTITRRYKPDDEKFISTWQWLDSVYGQDVIPPLTVLHDFGRFFIYDGNIRAAHALAFGYDVSAGVLLNQEDMDSYLACNPNLWSGITGFYEILNCLRIYAMYEGKEERIPDGMKEMIQRLK